MDEKKALRVCLPTMLMAVLLAGACSNGTSPKPDQPPTPVVEGAGATLVDLLNQGLAGTYRVTYQTTSFEGDPGDTFIFSSRPPLTRIQTVPENSSEPSSLIIADEDTAVSCLGGPDEWECFEIEPLGESLLFSAGPFVFVSATDLESFDVRETERRHLAGQDARCFRITPRQEQAGEEVEYCFNSNGVPLYSAPLFGIVEAVEFSLDVSDEDFVPPAEPQR